MSEIVQNPFVIQPRTVQPGRTRNRAFTSGELVVDAAAPLLGWEHTYFPEYFFAPEDVVVELRPAGKGPRSKALGPSEVFDVVVGDRTLDGSARRYPEAPVEACAVRSL